MSKPDNAIDGELRLILSQLHQAGRITGNNPRGEEIQADIDDGMRQISKLFTADRARLLESLRRELPEKYAKKPRYAGYGMLGLVASRHEGFDQAIDQVNQLLTKYVQGGENGENT